MPITSLIPLSRSQYDGGDVSHPPRHKRLRIAFVSKADAYGGGASRVAEELTELVNDAGHHAHHFCSWAAKGFSGIRRSLYGRRHARWRERHEKMKKLGYPELIPFELFPMWQADVLDSYDLFHFHDLSSAISPLTLRYIARRKPVVWTLHDCSPFTGGCLYPMGCERFQKPNGCGSCPQLGEWPIDMERDTTRFLRSVKKGVHASGITTVAPSDWMADMAMSSTIVPRRPLVISNGVDTDIYQPLDKATLRAEMGIPQDRPVFLVSAGNIDDPRKGVRFSIETLQKLRDLKPFVVVMGNANEAFLKTLEGIDHIAPGYISGAPQLNRHYSVADIFLFCSLADNQPLSVIEALASGTAVAGFATGGIPEQVAQNETGYLVPQGDVDPLAKAIREAWTSGAVAGWCKAARANAETRFSHRRLIADHMDLYARLVAEKFWGGPSDA